MLGMIMVDNSGDFTHVLWPLKESEWNGLSTADCVYPSFIFIMGTAIILSLKPSDKYTRSV